MSSYSRYGVPTVDTKLKLVVSDIHEFSSRYTLSLDEENKNLFDMVNVIDLFTKTTNLQGEAWYNLKLHYENNISVIRGQICANDSAKEDFQKLESSIGNEDLIAQEIYADIDELISRINYYSSLISNYNKTLYDYIFPLSYALKMHSYEAVITKCEECIRALGLKLTKLQQKQDSTKNLFLNATSLYAKVAQGISAINTSWNGTDFTIFSTEQWSHDLDRVWTDKYDKELSKLYYRDFAGRKEYYWNNIEDLFKKDPSKVTGAEYQIICDLYSQMDDSTLPKFFSCCYIPYNDNEKDINKKLEFFYPAAQYYKLSPVFIESMKQFNSSVENLVVSINYPFSEADNSYDFKSLEKLIARSTLAVNVSTYCPALARDNASDFEYENRLKNQSLSLNEWINPIQDVEYKYDSMLGTYGYSVAFNDGAMYVGGKWDYDMAHKIYAQSYGIKGGDFAQNITNKQVCEYLNGLVKSDGDLALGAGKKLFLKGIGKLSVEVVKELLDVYFIYGLFEDSMKNNKVKEQVSGLTNSIKVSEIMEPMGIYADVTTMSATSKDTGSSISHIQIDAEKFNNNTVYYLACQYTKEQNSAERLCEKFFNSPELLTTAEKNVLSDTNIKNMQKTLVDEFVKGEYGDDSTLRDYVDTVVSRVPNK